MYIYKNTKTKQKISKKKHEKITILAEKMFAKKNFLFCHNRKLVFDQSSLVNQHSKSMGGSMSVTEQGARKSLHLIFDWSDSSYHDWI